MKKSLKNRIIKIIIIIFLIIGGCAFLMSVPKIFSTVLLKTIEFLDDSPKVDSSGNIIYQDDRHTITSFGENKRFAIEKCSSDQKVTWFLFDRDKNKDIDMNIEDYDYKRISSCVYTKGEKGYTKLNFETAEIKQSQDISEFSQEDQEIFKTIKPREKSTKNK